MTVDLKALSAEFPRNVVSWRAQSLTKDGTKAMALAYIDARDVMERLDDVCGPDGWQCDYPHAGAKTVCRIGIKIGDEWVWKSNGAGDSDIEAEKGALSDAFKRAAVLWGIGRYLYSIESPWVPCESYETEYQGKKKWNWKRWTADPWSCVRGASQASVTKAPKAGERNPSQSGPYWDARFAVRDAKTVDEAKDAFGNGWKATQDAALRAEIKAEYDAKKLALTEPALNSQLDALDAALGGRAN
jgi:hypothetical protein